MIIPNLVEVLVQFLLGSILIYFTALSVHSYLLVIKGKDTPENHLAWFWSLLAKHRKNRERYYPKNDELEDTSLYKAAHILLISLITALTLTLGSLVITASEWVTDSSKYELSITKYIDFVIPNETTMRIKTIMKKDEKGSSKEITCYELNSLGEDAIGDDLSRYKELKKSSSITNEYLKGYKDIPVHKLANQLFYDANGKLRFGKINDPTIGFWKNITLIFQGVIVILLVFATSILPVFIISIISLCKKLFLSKDVTFYKSIPYRFLIAILVILLSNQGLRISQVNYFENTIGIYASYWNEKKREDKKNKDSTNQKDNQNSKNNCHLSRELQWMNNSTEYKVLTKRIYNNALNYLNTAINNKESKIIVIIDFDETIFSNYYYESEIERKQSKFSPKEFCAATEKLYNKGLFDRSYFVPGARDFLLLMNNRNIDFKIVTKRQNCGNLKVIDLINQLFSNSDLKTITESQLEIVTSKENLVKQEFFKDYLNKSYYPIFIGDNYFDFPQNKSGLSNFQLLENQFLIPNPRYGNWFKK